MNGLRPLIGPEPISPVPLPLGHRSNAPLHVWAAETWLEGSTSHLARRAQSQGMRILVRLWRMMGRTLTYSTRPARLCSAGTVTLIMMQM